MKKKILMQIILLITINCGISLTANAEQEYIVKLKNTLYACNINATVSDKYNFVVTDSAEEIQYYIDNEMAEYIEPNYNVELFSAPNDIYYKNQKYLNLINSTKAWDIETYGNDVRIAVIDSGCYRHKDILNNLCEGYDYIGHSSNTYDAIGHGTHISGIIAAEMNDIGVVGISSKAKIIPLKCFDTGTTTKVSTIIDAIYGAVDVYDCDIINMSWGIANNSKALSDAIDYAAQKDIIMIAAVGNGGGTDLVYPATYDSVIGVGSIDNNMNHSQSSRHNESVFVVAPGENIFGIDTDDSYSYNSGTSFSAPMVTATSAIALSIKKDLKADALKNLFKNSAVDLGDIGYDEYYGYGIINIGNLVDNMLQDEKVYLAPIELTNEGIKTAIYNVQNHLCEGIFITAIYANDELTKYYMTEMSLEPCKINEVTIPAPDFNENIKCFFWRNSNNIIPLSNTRIK